MISSIARPTVAALLLLAACSSPEPPERPETPAPAPAQLEELEQTAAANPTVANYVNLSLAYYQAGRFQQCIDAAQKAVAPAGPAGDASVHDVAAAHNNVCACHVQLGQWDPAIAACERALELKPGWQLALNNLARATSEKASRGPAGPRRD